jgi:poly-gamma-glutamate capsule biosynthesis protein CapA/YwtB (metallophosphatase superfamily)
MSFTLALSGQALLHGPLQQTDDNAVRELLRADIALCNLEASVASDAGWPTKTKTLHLATPAALDSLRALGFNSLAHANNHAFDLGPPGILATHAAAKAAGLSIAGSGLSIAEAIRPSLLPIGAARQAAIFALDLGPQPDIVYAAANRAGIAPLRMQRRIALPPERLQALREIVAQLGDDRRLAARQAVGYSASAAEEGLEAFGQRFVSGAAVQAHWQAEPADFEQLAQSMAAARAAGHFIVLCLHNHHWEPEWHLTPAWFPALARQLIAAGADVILGTGAPVLQPAQIIDGKPVFSGLGNFAFHTRRSQSYADNKLDVWRSVVLRLQIDDRDRCSAIELLPIAVGRPAEEGGHAQAPTALSGSAAAEILQRFSANLDDAGRALLKP